MFAAYMEKMDRLNDMILKLLQNISDNGENPCLEEEGEEYPDENGKKRGTTPSHTETKSDITNSRGYVTKEELLGLLKDQQSERLIAGTAFELLYPHDIQSKPYPKGYHPPFF